VSVVEVLFGLLGLMALGSALLVVTTRHLVHAALWLVVTLGSIAGCYLLLSAEFVAWVQVLIYVGAVVVLLLFGLMLTRAPIGASNELDSSLGQRLAAAITAGATAAVLVTSVVDAFHGDHIDLSDDSTVRAAGSSHSVGEADSVRMGWATQLRGSRSMAAARWASSSEVARFPTSSP